MMIENITIVSRETNRNGIYGLNGWSVFCLEVKEKKMKLRWSAMLLVLITPFSEFLLEVENNMLHTISQILAMTG